MPRERLIIEVTDKGTRVVQRNLDKVGRKGAAATSQVKGLSGALGALGGALVLQQSIGLLANFQQEMSTVKAITGATGAEFQNLSGMARELGATTRFSASEAAQGMTFLARAGFETGEVMESIDDTLRLAQAGALDLGSAADIASNVLKGFRLETDQAARVVDVLAKAANSSNTDVRQLGDAMKLVAPIAAGVGVEIEEATAAVGALSDAGLQATLAGTGLRRVISELESPSRKTRNLLTQMGLSAEEVKVSQVGLTSALKALADAGIDTGQALELFGDRGGPAFEVLKEAIPDVQKMTEELKNADGTAKDIADTMDDNLNGSLLALKSAAQEVVLAFGDMGGSANILRTIVDKLTAAIRFLGRHVEIVAGVLTALMIPAVKSLFALIAAHPVGLLVIALGAAVGALVSFKDEIKLTEGGVATLGDLFTVLGENITYAFEGLANAWGSVVFFITGQTQDMTGSMDLSIRGIATFFARVFDSVVATTQGAFTALVSVFQQLPSVLGDLFFQGANAAIRGIEYMINRGILLINRFIDEAEYATNLPGLPREGDHQLRQGHHGTARPAQQPVQERRRRAR
jgi:TP901 family phage tail tape measure protein